MSSCGAPQSLASQSQYAINVPGQMRHDGKPAFVTRKSITFVSSAYSNVNRSSALSY